MKIRVKLIREQQEPAMVTIVADGTATASDVATAIASVDLPHPVEPVGPAFTLQVEGDYSQRRTLCPETPLAESGVCSGSTLAVVQEGEGRNEPATIAALLRVIAGPDHGIEVPLRVGTSLIGRSPECQVRLQDRRLSKRHARVIVGRQIEVADENSANGVLIAGQKVTRSIVKPGDTVVMGETRIHVVPHGTPDQIAARQVEVRYLRPPIVQSRPQADEIALPDVPQPQRKVGFPWLAMIAPVLMGGVMFAFTRSPLTLLFVAMSPLLMMGSWIGNTVDAKRKHKADRANFDEAMTGVEEEIVEARELEAKQLRQLFPSVSTLVSSALNREGHLWSRRPEHPEFLQVRLGIGMVTPAVTITQQRRNGLVELVKRQRDLIAKYRLLPEVPVVANLRSVGGVGIAGANRSVVGIARGAVMQIAIMHSPAEVVIGCITSSAMKEEWRWLEWLPHCVSPHSPVAGPLLASDDGRGRALLDQLDELIQARVEDDEPTLRGPIDGQERLEAPTTPAVLLVVHDASVPTERLASIAERGPDAGVHLLWVAHSRGALPAACRTYLEVGEKGAGVIGMVRQERIVSGVSTEAMDVETANVTARCLAPVVDASVPVDDDSDLPRMVSVVGLLGQSEALDPQQVLARWQENGSLIDRSGPIRPREQVGDLRALVGHGGLEPFTLDLRSQGPHALVGGTTGAGKSEFLQAWVLGMAHAFSPDRVTFLFVDYKGGAAFAKCVELPHNVGLVTDLSPYLVRRALRSLRAEIRRREHLFHEKGVKDLIDFEKTGDPECPPSLIIIVDEFAALVGEVPEFIDGVVDVAQRGRSLGLHLILATQRPAGVIKDSLRANTNLRIALRMNDAHDSSDVLGSSVAANIDPATPGRGVARVGPGRLIPFQAAFPGARTPKEPPAPPIDVVELDFGVGTEWKIPRPKGAGTTVDKDINRVVDTLVQAAALGKVPPPRKPWLETLSPGYDLMMLNQRTDYNLVLGVVDDPDAQSQHVDFFHPDDSGNIVYYGAGGSGKTTALRSLAIAASITPRSGPIHIYGLDFAGGGLTMLEPLVNVGAIIAGDDEERISRLVTMLDHLLDDRAARYNAVRADSLRAYRDQPGKADEPRILVLVDGFGAFRTEYDSGLQRQATFAKVQRLINEGRAVGIHFAVTADRAAVIPSSMQGAFQHRMVLRMADEDAYISLGVPKDVLNAASPPGRCMNSKSPNELQLAVLGKDPSPVGQAREIEELAVEVARYQTLRPNPVLRLPEVILAEDLPQLVDGLPTLGMEDASLAPIGFEPQGILLFAGPPKSGLSSSVRWMAESMHHALPTVPRVLLSARSTSLSSLPLWTAAVTGPDRVRDYVEDKLKPYLDSEAAEGKPAIAIFVVQFPELAGSSCDMALTEAIKSARRNGHFFMGAGETATFNGFSSMITEIKSSRAGLLLTPESSDGDLLRASLPRVRAADFPPGRGFWVRNGGVLKVQLPVLE